jgi:hypothetical protein
MEGKMIVQKSIEIASPPDRIWSFLIEPEKIMKWCITLQNFKYTGEQRSGVGTPIYFEEKAAGQLMKLNFAITEWVEKQKIAFKLTSGNLVKGYAQRWAIETIPTGSKFTFWEEIKLPFGVLGKFIGLFGHGESQATVDKMLTRLKILAEA